MFSVVAEGLTKKFNSFTAVQNLNLNIEEGEVFGLLGPNGAGKTTTLRMLAALISPTEGSATVAGFDIQRDPSKVRQNVGILTENPSLYERLTAFENMDFFAEAYGITDVTERHLRIRVALEFLSLWNRRNDKVANYSKGMKQKLAIARTTLHKPKILFLDEPTAGLDPQSSKEIRDLITQLSEREKRTILLCTHHLEDAEKLCSRVLIMNKSKTLVTGTPEQLQEKTNSQITIKIQLKEINPRIIDFAKQNSQAHMVNANTQECTLLINVKDPRVATPEIVSDLVKNGAKILSVNILRPSLEDTYLKLIKEQPR
jgi:ABC-2 type transport system ATP-binding protein